jgi:hypothetical protein
MYMQLTTGKVMPSENGKYGIDNLKKIVRAAVNISKIVAELRANPIPQKFWGKVWYWLRGLFSNRARLADIGADFVQIATNADAIKAELLDLEGGELEQLIGLLVFEAGVSTPERFLKTLPNLLDAIRALADIID